MILLSGTTEVKQIMNFSDSFFFCTDSLIHRSLPKLSSQDEEGGAGGHGGFGGGVTHFEPIPHDHDFCERVVINVSINANQLL